MKRPDECNSIDEIRQCIDSLDRELIGLLAKRGKMVDAAEKFKKTTDDVKAQDRVQKMLQKRREWAAEEGLSPDMIENLYRQIVQYFINKEMKLFHEKHVER